jgi:hypothetical protein
MKHNKLRSSLQEGARNVAINSLMLLLALMANRRVGYTLMVSLERLLAQVSRFCLPKTSPQTQPCRTFF